MGTQAEAVLGGAYFEVFLKIREFVQSIRRAGKEPLHVATLPGTKQGQVAAR